MVTPTGQMENENDPRRVRPKPLRKEEKVLQEPPQQTWFGLLVSVLNALWFFLPVSDTDKIGTSTVWVAGVCAKCIVLSYLCNRTQTR